MKLYLFGVRAFLSSPAFAFSFSFSVISFGEIGELLDRGPIYTEKFWMEVN